MGYYMGRVKDGESPLVVGMRLLLGIGCVNADNYMRVMGAFECVDVSVQLDRVQVVATSGVLFTQLSSFLSKSADLADLLLFIGQHTDSWGTQWQDNVLAAVSMITGDVKFASTLDTYKKQISTLEADDTTTEFSSKLLGAIQFVDSMKALEQSPVRSAKRRSPLGRFSEGVANESIFQDKTVSRSGLFGAGHAAQIGVFGAGHVAQVGVFGGGHCQPIAQPTRSSGPPLAKRVKNP